MCVCERDAPAGAGAATSFVADSAVVVDVYVAAAAATVQALYQKQ